MRRFASVFSKRSGRSETTSHTDDSSPKDNSLDAVSPRKPARHPTLPQLVSDSGKSCSSTSSGSTTLPVTPIDEVIPRRPSRKASWKSWFGRRTAAEVESEIPPPIPPMPQSATTPAGEYSASLSDVDSLNCYAAQAAVSQAREKLRAMTLNKLRPIESMSPLIQAVDFGHVTYPRSCRVWGEAPKVETLGSRMLRKKLLDRLSVHLSPTDASSIVGLANRTSNPVMPIDSPLPNPNDISYPASKSIVYPSQGLRRWVNRPCYEERVFLYLPDDTSGGLTTLRVPGSHLGVPELDFSNSLQLLAGITYDDHEPDQPTPPLQQQSHGLPLPTSVSASPKPHPPPQLPPIPSVIYQPPNPVSPKLDAVKASSPVLAPKREVRFAEDGKEDQIPLGYVLRIKQRREEKARFLQQEKARRDKEEAERLQQEERLRQEAEQRRVQKEQDRKRQAQVDEERCRQSWAEEVKSARSRREAARAGHPSSLAQSDVERSRSTSRDLPRHRSQPQIQSRSPHSAQRRVYDVPSGPSMPHRDSSPAHSLSGSIRNSRPPSVYSSYTNSSEDVRSRDSGRFNRRNTIGIDPMMMQYPVWNGSFVPPVPTMPQMPQMPYVSHMPMGTPIPTFSAMPTFAPLDMPLLPPSAPFMMGQSSRRNSSTSLSSNAPSNRNSLHAPRSGSFEGGHSGNRSSSGSNYSAHHRRPSNESSPTSSRGDSPHSGSLTDLRERRPSAPRTLSAQIPPYSHQSRKYASPLPHTQTTALNGYDRRSASPFFQPPADRRQSTIS